MNKKNLFLIISAFFQIIISGVSICMIDFIRRSTLDFVKFFPESFQDTFITIYNNDLIFIIPNVISIIIGLIIIFLVFKNSVEYCKNSILVLSIIEFLIAPNFIINILCIGNIIVSATTVSKAKNNGKNHIPCLDRIDMNSSDVIAGVICLACYFFQIFIPSSDSFVFRLVISILYYLLVLLVCLVCFRKNFKRDIVELKNNFKAYVSFLSLRLVIMYVSYFVISFVCFFLINHDISVNQQKLDLLPLWYLIPLACVYAPIVEELLFRGCIRRFINSDIVYIIVSGLIFGLLHTLGESSIGSMIILTIPYAFVGSFYAYIYTKTNNVMSTILCHCFHNSISIIFQILFLR